MSIDYTIVYSKRKTLAIHILKEGSVEVRAPKKMTKHQIESFVREKAHWILEKKSEVLEKQTALKTAKPISRSEHLQLCEEMREKLSCLGPLYTNAIGIGPKKMTIKDQSSRWGSCSSKGNVSLNWRLALVPDRVFHYVLVHEMCHLVHMNHGKDFWHLVAQHCIDFNASRKWLKENGHMLMAIDIQTSL